MKIRKATFHDAPFIRLLLSERQVTISITQLITQMNTGFNNEDNVVLVCEDRDEVIGFALLHYVPRLSGHRYLLLISELVTRERVPGTNSAGLALKHHISQLAEKQQCERVEWLTY